MLKSFYAIFQARRSLRLGFRYTYIFGAIAAAAVLTTTAFAVFPLIPTSVQAADPVSCASTHTVVTCLDVTANNAILDVNVTPTPSGTFASGASTVTVKTNAPGYDLSLSTNTTNSNLVNGGNTLAPTTGNFTGTQTALDANTWGFTLNATPSAASTIWSAVPVVSSPVTLKTNQSANDTTGDSTTIHYGTKVDSTKPSGIYTATLVYTATASAFPAPTITSVSPSTVSTAGGTIVTITGTNFYDVVATTGVTIGGTNCTSFTVASPTSITCTTPVKTTGTYDVTVTTASGTDTATNSLTYVTPIVVSSVSPNIASTTAGIESGPAFTIVGYGFTGATGVTIGGIACPSFTVLSDTQIACTGPTAGLTDGAMPVVVTKSGPNSNDTITVTYNSTAYPTLQDSAAFSSCTSTPSIFRDTRDSQLYYVKAMADGNCWMVDNLKYGNYGTLTTSGYLTVDGTSAGNPDAAKYVDQGATTYCVGTADMPANTVTKCGFLYNWFTATAGTGNSSVTGGSVAGSICPADWRLPMTDGAVDDFYTLNGWMAGLGAPSTDSSLYANWLYNGQWQGVYSGTYPLFQPGQSLSYHSSSSNTATTFSLMNIYTSSLSFGVSELPRSFGVAVRCVLPPPPPPVMQTITTDTCPTTRTMAVDARDNRTYWVQKLADGQCWMLTNLAYAGGGTNTYGDVKNITNSETLDYTQPYYMIPTGANPTTSPTEPSTSTDGGVTNPQYGYLYNWCAAMGAQTSTSACANATTPAPNTSISICPAGWRLPTSNGGEFTALNNAVNSGSTSTDAGLRSTWLGMYSGGWSSGFYAQGSFGYYWMSTQYNATNAYYLSFGSTGVTPSTNLNKGYGFAVRCVTQDMPPTLDVTPTTGWAGDTINITGNGIFANVTAVMVGGTACTSYAVVSPSQITCVLPAKVAGSVNDIAVTANGSNVTNAATYSHMKITYFDPGRTEIIGGTIDANGGPVSGGTSTNNITFSTFTSTDCGNMTLYQVVNLTDTRNGQTYRVKKMTANVNGGRCWMIDNLKFPTGLYGPGPGGGSLTIDGSTGGSRDISRYVNPHSQAYCYGTTDMPAGSLTRCGYLYNWYGATYGTGNSTVSTQYSNVNGSICPNNSNDGNTTSSPWQLPTGIQRTGTSGNGHFAWLNALMNNQSASASATTNTLFANWMPTGQYQGVHSGYYGSSFVNQGISGYNWSSTVSSAGQTYRLNFVDSEVNPGNRTDNTSWAQAVRCVLP